MGGPLHRGRRCHRAVYPGISGTLARFEYARVSIPVAILIWLMIYPMMLKVDFASIVNVTKRPQGLTVTCVTNWLIKPFTMYAIAWFFLKVVFPGLIATDLATEYLAEPFCWGLHPVRPWPRLEPSDRWRPCPPCPGVNGLIILFAFCPSSFR